ncbi:MAG: glycosyltransferase [Haliscomenobacter sp.]|nr:glycosyltransferase [Haliscomenobacter sp.]
MQYGKKRILVAPLDWGLGHASRSIAVIKALLAREVDVLLGSYGRPLALLRREFPQLESIELPPYDVKYPTGNIYFNVAIQLPQILKAMAQENRIVAGLVNKKQLDGIISDHRLGCRNPGVPSVVIAHQLHLRLKYPWLRWPVREFHYGILRRFDEVWIPDYEATEDSLAGNLDHPPVPAPPATYIGPLSRIGYRETPSAYDAFILLSGPEPQRTRLEEVLLKQAVQLEGNILLVQGKTDVEQQARQEGNVEIIPYLTSADLEEKLAASKIVICRSGYSTLMDLASCRKKALLVPTPGQTEQEYLSDYLQQKGFFLSKNQSEINLSVHLPEALEYKGFPPAPPGPSLLESALDGFLKRVEAAS